MEENLEEVIVGLISDTHGVLEDAAIQALKRATHTIIHAGDVGDRKYKNRLSTEQVIKKLQQSTSKTIIAVSGNVDEGFTDLPDSANVTINGKRLLVKHICGFPPAKEIEEEAKLRTTDIVVFGHSHVPGAWWHNSVLFVNPGSAGPRRFKLPRCIAFLLINKTGEIRVEFAPVDTLPQDRLLPDTFKINCEEIQESSPGISESKRRKL